MFNVVYTRGYALPQEMLKSGDGLIVMACVNTLEEAKAARKTNGDLITDEKFRIVTDEIWHDDWEIYCQKMIEKQKEIG